MVDPCDAGRRVGGLGDNAEMSDDAEADAMVLSPMYRAMVAGGVDYRPWAGQGLDEDQCFLCSDLLDDDSRTTEDVIPRWMQRTLCGGHQSPSILLPNLTPLPLDKIKIPACRSCNGGHLSRIEKEVSAAFRAGPAAVADLAERILRIWFAKIACGIRRNDMRLRQEVRDPSSQMIASRADLEQLGLLHLLLQEAREVVHMPDGHSTFFVFPS
jgi:hypothetical protein